MRALRQMQPTAVETPIGVLPQGAVYAK
jgi:hypothetical protein